MIVSRLGSSTTNFKSFCAAIERVATHMHVDVYSDVPMEQKNVTVHARPLHHSDIDASKIVAYVPDDVLFTPDAFLIAIDMLNHADYVCGCDSQNAQLVSVQYVASRWWKTPGTMMPQFVARGATILQDALIVKEYDETAWRLLRLMHGRRCASPMPSIWQLENAPLAPGIPWQSFR